MSKADIYTVTICRPITITKTNGSYQEDLVETIRNQTWDQVRALRAKHQEPASVMIEQQGVRASTERSVKTDSHQTYERPVEVKKRAAPKRPAPLEAPSYADAVNALGASA
jgi:hypothetical protein